MFPCWRNLPIFTRPGVVKSCRGYLDVWRWDLPFIWVYVNLLYAKNAKCAAEFGWYQWSRDWDGVKFTLYFPIVTILSGYGDLQYDRPSEPLLCRKRRLRVGGGGGCLNETGKTGAPCHRGCSAIENPPCSNLRSCMAGCRAYRPKFSSTSPSINIYM